MDEARRTEIINQVQVRELAHMLCDRLPDEAQTELKDAEGQVIAYAINSDYVPVIAELLQEIVANTVSTLIDAGSERDAVMENEDLYGELVAELEGWTASAVNEPIGED